MAAVVQLCKHLDAEPPPGAVTAFTLRHYSGEADIAAWLQLRQLAFAREKLSLSLWSAVDFQREFLDKPWWSPERMWFVCDGEQLVGSVTLSERGTARPAVHWLMVHPRYRRRGIASVLLNALERTCWQRGECDIVLETHMAWGAALQFYRAIGYRLRGSTHAGLPE